MSRKKVDWAKYHNRHSWKSIIVTRLLFCQNDCSIGESIWQKDSLVTPILFWLCLLWYLAQSQILVTALYVCMRILERKVHPNKSVFSWYLLALRDFWMEENIGCTLFEVSKIFLKRENEEKLQILPETYSGLGY